MKSIDSWKPTKYLISNGRLKASNDRKYVGTSSMLIISLIAEFYQHSIPKYCSGELVDLGCGNVPLYGFYKDYVEGVTCIDWDGSRHNNIYLDFTADLNKPLDFLESRSYNTIILSDVLEHLLEPEMIWTEMGRILKPGGTLILNVPFFYWIHEVPHDYHRYTKFALSHYAECSGFKIIDLQAYGGVPEILADIFSKIIVKLPLLGNPIARIIQFLTWHFIHSKPGRKMSKQTSVRFPLGYKMIAIKN